MTAWFRLEAIDFIEFINGLAITPGLLWLVMIAIYLSKEAKRRKLHPLDWFSLPPSMDFMLAIFISDLGMWIRSFVAWLWSRRGGGEFTKLDILFLGGASALIIFGALCKIRALTRPDHGSNPWLVAMCWTVVMGILLLFFS